MEEREKIAISSQSNNDRYGKMHSCQKVKQQGATRLVLRMYEDWQDPIDRDLLAVQKAKQAIATPPPKPKAEKDPKEKVFKTKVFHEYIKTQLKALLPQILHSDRALGCETIRAKANALGLEINEITCREYLRKFAIEGFIFKVVKEHKYNAYALQQTDKIDSMEWLPAILAYKIAIANGYQLSYNYFHNKPHSQAATREKVIRFYFELGIEYRFDADERCNCKWRALNGNVS